MITVSYRLVASRAERLAKQPCWFVERRHGLEVVDTTNYQPTKFRAMYEASKRWPDLGSTQELTRLLHA